MNLSQSKISVLKNILIKTIALSFVLFIVWIIYLADTGGTIVFVKMVKFLPYPDKFGHFFLFGLLALVINMASKFEKLKMGKHLIFKGSVYVFVFAFLEELSQGFLPTRSMDYMDVIADGLGILLFTLITPYFASIIHEPIEELKE